MTQTACVPVQWFKMHVNQERMEAGHPCLAVSDHDYEYCPSLVPNVPVRSLCLSVGQIACGTAASGLNITIIKKANRSMNPRAVLRLRRERAPCVKLNLVAFFFSFTTMI